jgi:hypothetical protein
MGNRNLCTNRPSSAGEHPSLLCSNVDTYFTTSHRVLDKIIFAKNDTLLLAVVPSPDTMHLPYAHTFCWTIGAPGLPTGGIQHTTRSETSRKREGARPVGNEGGVPGAKHERFKSRCCTRPVLSTSNSGYNLSVRTDMCQMQICIVVKLMQ